MKRFFIPFSPRMSLPVDRSRLVDAASEICRCLCRRYKRSMDINAFRKNADSGLQLTEPFVIPLVCVFSCYELPACNVPRPQAERAPTVSLTSDISLLCLHLPAPMCVSCNPHFPLWSFFCIYFIHSFCRQRETSQSEAQKPRQQSLDIFPEEAT